MHYDRAKNITQNFMDKKKQMGVTRSDLLLSDYMKIDASSAKVLVRYNRANGAPDAEAVQNYLIRLAEGSFIPQMETARNHDNPGCVSVCVTTPKFTRDLEDSKAMHEINAFTFMDYETKSTWEVTESDAKGIKFLQRVNGDKIDEILAERKKRIGVVAHASHFTFANVVNAGTLQISKGDYVEFYSKGLRRGEVQSVGSSEVRITADDGESFSVSPTSVVSILKQSAEKQAAEDNAQEKHYSEIYGPDFAKKLMKYGSKV